MNLSKGSEFLTGILPKICQLSLRNYRHQPTMIARYRRHETKRWPNRLHKWPGGEQHYKFTYYPRYPDQEDPSWEPTPLFLITRRKPMKGQPWWHKKLLQEFRIEQPSCYTNIVLNDEATNAKLWQIKHLITITPITFPDGIPTEQDIGKCHLYENGELRISAQLGVEEERLAATERFQNKIDTIDKHMIERHLRQRWLRPYVNFLKSV